MNCDGCGACCMGMGSPPFDRDDGELDSLPGDVRADFSIGMTLYAAMGYLEDECFWLGIDRRCMFHEHKPQLCRDFAVGSKDCRRQREHLLSTAGLSPALT